MTHQKKYQEFIKAYPGIIKRRVPLARYCTFKIGGPADLLIEAKNPEQLMTIVQLAHRLKLRYLVIGGGSNLLFDDKGFRGLVVRYVAQDVRVDSHTNTVAVDGGCWLNRLVKHSALHNLGGMDFLANIPGSVGGAIVGNAGCYGKAIADVLMEIDLFNVKTGERLTINPSRAGFSYRNSKLKNQPHLLVLGAKFQLVPDSKSQILKRIEQEWQERLRKHPHAPCAGSFFKNPPGEAAWKLIAAAGMRGFTVGGARVSNKHPNHLINYHRATAQNVRKLANKVIKAVKSQTGVILHPEVRYVGPDGTTVIS